MNSFPQQQFYGPSSMGGGFGGMGGGQQFGAGYNMGMPQQFNTGFGGGMPGGYDMQQNQNYQMPPQKPPRVNVKLENNERGFYSNLWSQVDNEDNGKVTGKEVVPFFQRSGLPKEVLREIWLIASTDNEYLDRDEFYVALRLIAYAQNNIDVSRESIIANTKAPLPKFTMVQPKPPQQETFQSQSADPSMMQQQQLQQNMQQQGFQQGFQAPNQFGFPQQNPEPSNALMLVNKAMDYGSAPMQLNPMQISPMQVIANSFIIPSPYDINIDMLKKYESYFEKIDQMKLGLFTNIQAKEIFARSQLPGDVLFLIWKTSDTGETGLLDKAEFIVAVHLLALAKSGVEILPVLPMPLQTFITEYRKLLPPKQELIARYKNLVAQQQQQLQAQQQQPGQLNPPQPQQQGFQSPSQQQQPQTQLIDQGFPTAQPNNTNIQPSNSNVQPTQSKTQDLFDMDDGFDTKPTPTQTNQPPVIQNQFNAGFGVNKTTSGGGGFGGDLMEMDNEHPVVTKPSEKLDTGFGGGFGGGFDGFGGPQQSTITTQAPVNKFEDNHLMQQNTAPSQGFTGYTNGVTVQKNEQDGVVFDSVVEGYQKILSKIQEEDASFKSKMSGLETRRLAMIKQVQDAFEQIQKEFNANQTLRNLMQQKLIDYDQLNDKLRTKLQESKGRAHPTQLPDNINNAMAKMNANSSVNTAITREKSQSTHQRAESANRVQPNAGVQQPAGKQSISPTLGGATQIKHGLFGVPIPKESPKKSLGSGKMPFGAKK